MTKPFEGFDMVAFWNNPECDQTDYIDLPVTDERRSLVEATTGYRLPESYVALAAVQNGGIPARLCYPTQAPTSWARDHIALNGISSIGAAKPRSLLGPFSSAFWHSEWGYPQIGIYFADCPSAGHDMLCLDYSDCGPTGEPKVVHVDQELNYRVTVLAETFEIFIRGLQHDADFS